VLVAYTHSAMIGTYLTVLAGLAGLAFGSFLNTCASRWPKKESVIKPRSHCRHCERTLAWWENIPLVSWLALRGRCRSCAGWIGLRYPLAELAVGVLWAFCVWRIFAAAPELDYGTFSYHACSTLADGIARLIFLWLLVALAVLDAENFWLPDRLLWIGIALGLLLSVTQATLDAAFHYGGDSSAWQHLAGIAVIFWFLFSVIPAGVILVIRFIYHWVRGNEGLGMGDVKLMAMLGGWLHIQAALLSFGIAVVIGAVVALFMLGSPAIQAKREDWSSTKLPFGTFLCLGAMVSTFWGEPIIALYRRWVGL
jgi:leader peptidase (prepilin peptidase) / N-methyltransferase